jgi:hypothetical protein
MLTIFEIEHLEKAITSRRMYESKVTFSEIARRLDVHPSTARRLAEKAGAVVSNRDDQQERNESDTKQCRSCMQWKNKSEFYKRSGGKVGQVFSYCKRCDSNRATAAGKRSRIQKRMQKESIARERFRHNSQTRRLLIDAMTFIERIRPESAIIDEIMSHIGVGKRLFGDDS